ncbi:ABC transporter permease [Propioniciclava soli]|uniref:ABC transporter permease n=1 Tax=Propioniciclava soli TaxID=2775081 RepID=A0ABZ3CCB6_9ACTN|nr:ABC transporter permease [Propioniciclava soli]
MTPTNHAATPASAPSESPDRAARTEAAARDERARERRLRTRDLVLAVATPVALLALWEVAARAGWIDIRVFSSPTAVAAQAATMASDGSLATHTLATLGRLTIGGLIGAVLGVVVGLLMGTSRALNAALGPTFAALYALPKVAILPILLFIFGLTETPRILSVVISVFFIMQINTVAGVHAIDAKLLEAARAYGARGLDRFRFVILPGALPYVFAGFRVAVGTGVIVITAVEMLASNTGLGYLIWNSWTLFMPARMYVGLVMVSLLGAGLTALFALLERRAIPWRRGRRAS